MSLVAKQKKKNKKKTDRLYMEFFETLIQSLQKCLKCLNAPFFIFPLFQKHLNPRLEPTKW